MEFLLPILEDYNNLKGTVTHPEEAIKIQLVETAIPYIEQYGIL